MTFTGPFQRKLFYENSHMSLTTGGAGAKAFAPTAVCSKTRASAQPKSRGDPGASPGIADGSKTGQGRAFPNTE